MKTITMMTIGLAIGAVLCAPTVFAQPGVRAKKSDKASEKSARPTPLITGETAPPFVLKSLDGKSETDTSSFRGQRPIILFFGSYT